MSSPRILVFAYSGLGHACLNYLLSQKENVVGVFTHQDQPGENIWFPSVEKLAVAHGTPVWTMENLSEKTAQEHVQSLKPDLIFSFYYRNLIPVSILSLAPLGAFNMHGSFLPKYRGRAPINWAILNGETETGATLHVMTEKADAGDIVDQEKVAIGPDESAIEIQNKVTEAAVVTLERQIANLKEGRAPRHIQDAARASYFGRRRPEDGKIDWSWPAQRIHNLVRALTRPFPGAYGDLGGDEYFIWKTRLRSNNAPQDSDGLIVKCGDETSLEILSLQKRNGMEISKENV